MAVRPISLRTPEDGLQLEDRPAESAPRPGPRPVEAPQPTDELRELKGRIKALKLDHPPDTETHCRACFVRGVKATLKALE